MTNSGHRNPGRAYLIWLASGGWHPSEELELAFRAGWEARYGRQDDDLIGVREAGLRLGVHENTVRNWARSGVLATAAWTASGFRRYDPADVEELRQRLRQARKARKAGGR